MFQVTIEEASERLAQLIEQVNQGEEVVLIKDEQPVARLVPVSPASPIRPGFGSARGLIWMADDFDAPLVDLAEYQ